MDASLSVIVPVYNGARFVRDALASVARATSVSEIIVVDDGSTDDSAAIAKDADERVIVVNQLRQGPAAARNAGLVGATSPFVAFLDADDVWAPSHPEVGLEYLCQHDDDVVFGKTQCTHSEPGELELHGPQYDGVQLGSVVCRRSVFDRVGYFEPTVRYGEDLDWYLRVRDAGCSIARLPSLSLYYRIHSGNRPTVHETSRTGLLTSVHRALARKALRA